jgi:hypothetical protein
VRFGDKKILPRMGVRWVRMTTDEDSRGENEDEEEDDDKHPPLHPLYRVLQCYIA